ncbi:AI-2E family transporter [Silvanigrella aquatica]|uniref:AI-2E family transporter n=1 Tax=Silvanigrella aquatica TaxID=1915309 RepID=A0A1L4D2J5_9BACT|nr:AI-2E family transporter [Silvanigrella aquatica]APJ04423.1 hypothetical protein AXG55_11095 [Silvanigrella aquatica]
MKKHRGKIFFLCFFLIALFLFLFLNIVIGPLILAFIASYLLNPVFEFLEKKGIQRSLIALATLFLMAIISFISIWILFPILFEQFQGLSKLLPEFKIYLEENLFPKIQDFIAEFTGQNTYTVIHLYDILPINLEKFSDAILSKLSASTHFIASILIMILFTPFFSYFLMRDFNKVHNKIFDLVPQDIKPIFTEFVDEVNKKLRAVLRGQSLVILTLCFLYPTALLIAGLPTAIAVGVLTGLARFVPYMDILVGSFLCFFVLVSNSASGHLILSVSLAFLAVQCLDGLFITPRIMGRFSGIHPSLVILSVLCFGDWFGFFGVLLAIPIAAVGKVSFNMLIKSYKESTFYKNDNTG